MCSRGPRLLKLLGSAQLEEPDEHCLRVAVLRPQLGPCQRLDDQLLPGRGLSDTEHSEPTVQVDDQRSELAPGILIEVWPVCLGGEFGDRLVGFIGEYQFLHPEPKHCWALLE